VPLAQPFPPNFGGGPAASISYQYENSRRVYASDGSEIRIRGENYPSGDSSVIAGMPGGINETTGRPFLLRSSVVLFSVEGSTLTLNDFPGPSLDLGGTLPLDQVAKQWGEGARYIQLLPQSIPGRPDDFRLCWLYRSDSAEPAVFRLQCSEHRRIDGVNVGAYVVDDVGGTKLTYAGTW